MDTRGVYAYMYRGRYYVHYNHRDSYPHGLGMDVFRTIPSDPEKFKEWLENMRRKFIEYVYIIDLDNERFSCNNCIVQAGDACEEDTFRFREVSFALLSLASCSPELVRFASTENIFPKFDQDYALYNETEFVSKLARGYHITGNQPGSAPQSTTYWLLNVLVCISRNVDLASRAGFKDAIVSAVAKGRSEGKAVFKAVVCSISRVVLIHVTEDRVEHTNCLPWTAKLTGEFQRYMGKEVFSARMAVKEPDDGGLFEQEMTQEHTFHLLALLFEDAQFQK
ncbi:hypothetical protein P280DRAFT_513009 [Massarina eburnea CBS 473.64]|uniref:Uncharacterized protein n=1 Tax=Massarina eburnea CBS 473.64 TaxID=1395130 RepID=A0A6A6SIM5_9PLEO|nr:hypothetical protein P280DRAFT_513009 [Massarina eburnea CBS 473.64]